MSGIIRIKRDSGYVDSLRAYKVILDGEVIGEIRDGQVAAFDVPSGIHDLQLKVDWCTSNTVKFKVEDKTVVFECGSSLRGLRILLMRFYTTFYSNQYIWLRKITQ